MANRALDPTRPAWIEPIATVSDKINEVKKSPALSVSGILYASDRKLVMLNNRYYRVGEFIGQQRITRIERDRIWLSSTNQSGQSSHELVLILPRVSQIQKSKKAAAHE
jgi:hypothetical protein